MLRRSMGSPINPKSGQIQWCDGLEEKESRTIFVKIHQVEYLISWEVLNQVFSTIGDIEVIEIFDKDFHYHSRIRFKNGDSVIKAFDSLNGRCIYDDCCRMELFVVGRASSGLIENDSSAEDVTIRRVNQLEATIEDANQVEEFKESDSSWELSSSETKKLDSDLVRNHSMNESSLKMNEGLNLMTATYGPTTEGNEELRVTSEASDPEIEEYIKETQIPHTSLEVNSESLEVEIPDVACDTMGAFAESIDFMKVSLSDSKVDSFDFFANLYVRQVFVVMPIIGFNIGEHTIPLENVNVLMGNCIFDPGIVEGQPMRHSSINNSSIQQEHMFVGRSSRNFDPGGVVDQVTVWTGIFVEVNQHTPKTLLAPYIDSFVELSIVLRGFFKSNEVASSFIFDPGGGFALLVTNLALDLRGYNAVVEAGFVDQRLQWDPGGSRLLQMTGVGKRDMVHKKLLWEIRF